MRGYAKISNSVFFVGDDGEEEEGEIGVEVEQPMISSSRRVLFIVLPSCSLSVELLVGAMSLTSMQGSSSSKTKRTSCVCVYI